MSSLLKKEKYTIAKAVNLLAACAVLACFSSWATQAAANDAAVQEQITAAERAASRGSYATDGVFTGAAEGFGGTVEVAVTIENGYIDLVEIVDASHEDADWLDMAIVLLDEIVDEQTSALDVVSGATYTSAGILNATTEALQKSLDGEAGEGA